MIHFINGIAEPWSRYMASATLQATLLALVVLGLLQIGRSWRPAWRYAFMMLALCKFVVPPMLSLPTGLFSRIQPPPLTESGAELHEAPPVVQNIYASIVNAPRDPAPSLPEIISPPPALSTNSKLLLLHLVGALVILALAAAQKIRLRRLASQSIAVKDPALAEAYHALCRDMKLSRRPRLLISKDNHIPMAFGLWKPVVMLPESLVAVLPLSETLVVLGHEMAHHRRRDLWISWLQVIVAAIWWFNPVYWLLSRSIRGVREDCCDDLVLASGLASREDYCRTLLKVVRTTLEHQTVIQTDFAYLGESLPLRRRFKRIMSARFIRAPKLAAAGMLSVTALAFILLPGVQPQIIVRGENLAQPLLAKLATISQPDNEQRAARNGNAEDALKTGSNVNRAAERAPAPQPGALGRINKEKAYLPERMRYASIYPGVDAILDPILDAVKAGDLKKIKAMIKDNPELVSIRDFGHATPLHWAVEFDQKDLAALLLAKRADVNAADNNGETPLHVAAIIGRGDVAETLLARGADINIKNRSGLMPIHCAARNGNKNIAELLLAHKAGVRDKTLDGATPLHLAGNKEIAEFFLARGADVNARNNKGETPLHMARNKDIAEFLLSRGADVNARNSKGETPLDMAATTGLRSVMTLSPAASDGRRGVLELLRPSDPIFDAVKTGDLAKVRAILMANPALISSKDSNGETPLHIATLMDRRAVAELLLANKADINAANKKGATPLIVAVIEGYKDIVELLLANKANLNGGIRVSGSPLHEAARSGLADIVELLLAKGADIHARDLRGRTPLHWASEYRQYEIAKMLLAHKADVNAGDDREGLTLLHEAAKNGRKDTAEFLLTNKANVNARAKYGATPLHEAAWHGNKEIVELLLIHDAEVNARDNGGGTPLRLAVDRGNQDIAELLRRHGGHE
jgi:ankyrin repeat protein/beta-lactamase regulating signal transducer with metallopeptidase domain